MDGLRLVLSIGVPGPWGEAAKNILHVKKIPFVPVVQVPGMPNEDLVEWTGHANAPVAVYNDEAPRTGWKEILDLSERISPEPTLVPDCAADRERMYDICDAICGKNGLGWSRRLMMVEALLSSSAPAGSRRTGEMLAERYGYTKEAVVGAPGRAAEVLKNLSMLLRDQERAGRDYLVGDRLTAADLYWAAFAVLLRPMPAALCPMPEFLRGWYENVGPVVADAMDPALFAHRDRIYLGHLPLPMSF
jgi:glutathione S-transferase